MSSTPSVHDLKRRKDIAGNAACLRRFEGTASQEISERESRDAFHDNEGSLNPGGGIELGHANVEHACNVLVNEPG